MTRLDIGELGHRERDVARQARTIYEVSFPTEEREEIADLVSVMQRQASAPMRADQARSF